MTYHSSFLSDQGNPFPEIHMKPYPASPEGIVAIGGTAEPQLLIWAYRRGVFPWPQSEEMDLLWFSPDPRGVLDFQDLHIPKSWKKDQRRWTTHWRRTKNQAFAQVMSACQKQPRPGQQGTWITQQTKQGYLELHRLGYAHSWEVWDESGQLIGGIYGVQSEKYFSAESMFYHQSFASKWALLSLIEDLQQQGHTWMDTQMVTPVSAALGAKLIPRHEFFGRLSL